jgi:uncharacterized protein
MMAGMQPPAASISEGAGADRAGRSPHRRLLRQHGPRALWQAGGATALFIAGFGAVGIVLIFVHIPGADLAYSILGLVIFAGFTMFDFQRLRTNTDITAAPLLAASIFLDELDVFLFFLQIFSAEER